MNTSSDPTVHDENASWNQAHDRLRNFLNTFALDDHAQVSRLTVMLLDQARELHRQDPTREPVTLVMAQAQKQAEQWLAGNLEIQDKAPSQLLATGYIALLLSQTFRAAPETFLTSPLPEKARETMRQTLLITGPDLEISSMTPRDLDYGPMLALARRTWHRWNSREVITALVFWAAVYVVFYSWLSDAL